MQAIFQNKTKLFKIFLCVVVFIFGFVLGAWRYHFVEEEALPSVYETVVGKEVAGEALIIGEPDVREKSTLLTVLVEPSRSKMLFITERYPEFSYGDTVSFKGVLEKPESFETEGGQLFDYPSYLAKDGIYYVLFRPQITLLQSGSGNFIKRNLLLLKSEFMRRAGYYIPEPEISLLGGLLVGAKHGLSAEVQMYLRNAGIIHVVVLSGYNITLVADAIMKLFAFFSYRLRFICGAGAILLFAVMTGGSATVVRASLMALLVLLAKATGRTYQITRALLIAGIAMVLYTPKILVFDPSFQLSFLATIGLIYIAPAIEKYFTFVPSKFQIKEFLVSTISTQIFVTPLLLHMTGKFSVVSLLTNLLVLPTVPITMFFGFVTGVLGFFTHALSLPFAYATYLLLHFELGVAHFLGSLPFSSLSISYFPPWLMAFCYIILTALFGYFRLVDEPVDKKASSVI